MAARLGRYEVLKHLASGGMADVLLGRTDGIEGFERHVVLKRIKPEHSQDLRFIRMLLEEARVAANLHHQHIVQVHDIGETAGEYFIAMEYLHGEDVRNILLTAARSRQHVPLGYAMAIVSAAAAGLHYAHERRGPDKRPLGIVHRDVSPSNILVGYDGSIKIVDFGIAKASARQETRSSNLKGKISYMSPEQCKSAEIDRRSDVYSLGIVLYELATTSRLFKGTNDYLVMDQIVNGRVPPPQSRRPDLPAELSAIIMRAIAPDPERRFATADELRRAIDQVADRLGLNASSSAIAAYMRQQFGEKPEPWLELSAPHVVPLGEVASAGPQPGGGWTELWRSDAPSGATGPSPSSGPPLGSGLVPRASGPIGTGVGGAAPRSAQEPRETVLGSVNPPASPDEKGRETATIPDLREAARGGVNRPAVPDEPPADGKISPLGLNPREVARGGVNRPAVPDERGRESPLGIDLREAARGKVNRPAAPDEPPADGKISPLGTTLREAARRGVNRPAVPDERGRESPLEINLREAARRGVNRPAAPDEPPADGKISPLEINLREAARRGVNRPAAPDEPPADGKISPLGIDLRETARGGVNRPAVPDEPPADGKISPLRIDPREAARGGGNQPAVPDAPPADGKISALGIDLREAARGGGNQPAVPDEREREGPPWTHGPHEPTRPGRRPSTAPTEERIVWETTAPTQEKIDWGSAAPTQEQISWESTALNEEQTGWESPWTAQGGTSLRSTLIAAAIAVPLFTAIGLGIWWFGRTDALPAHAIQVKPVSEIPPIEEVTKLAVPAAEPDSSDEAVPAQPPTAQAAPQAHSLDTAPRRVNPGNTAERVAPVVEDLPTPGSLPSPPAPARPAALPTPKAPASAPFAPNSAAPPGPRRPLRKL